MSNVEVAELSGMDDLIVEPKTLTHHIFGLEVDGSDLARSNVGGVLANQRRSATRSVQKFFDGERLTVLDCWCCKVL